ncbi:hypothetical protein GR254_24800, partial [Mycobacterium tuberculosis]|nr:hypothetical protein [Mycobacterium tuberculosis]
MVVTDQYLSLPEIRLVPDDEAPGWELVPSTDIANEHYRLAVDPERGGALS